MSSWLACLLEALASLSTYVTPSLEEMSGSEYEQDPEEQSETEPLELASNEPGLTATRAVVGPCSATSPAMVPANMVSPPVTARMESTVTAAVVTCKEGRTARAVFVICAFVVRVTGATQ